MVQGIGTVLPISARLDVWRGASIGNHATATGFSIRPHRHRGPVTGIGRRKSGERPGTPLPGKVEILEVAARICFSRSDRCSRSSYGVHISISPCGIQPDANIVGNGSGITQDSKRHR